MKNKTGFVILENSEEINRGLDIVVFETEDESMEDWKDQQDPDSPSTLYEVTFRPIKKSPSTEWVDIT